MSEQSPTITKTILLLEDDLFIQDDFQILFTLGKGDVLELTGINFDIVATKDQIEALRALKTHNPDVLIVDTKSNIKYKGPPNGSEIRHASGPIIVAAALNMNPVNPPLIIATSQNLQGLKSAYIELGLCIPENIYEKPHGERTMLDTEHFLQFFAGAVNRHYSRNDPHNQPIRCNNALYGRPKNSALGIELPSAKYH